MKLVTVLLTLCLALPFAISYPRGTSNSNDGRIINGSDASAGEFPYIASVQFGTQHICSGFIYSELYVATAGSCVANKVPSQLSIVVGITSLIDYSPYAQKVDVVAITVHPAYDSVTKVNDIAILKLAGPFILTPGVQIGYYDEVSISSRFADTMGWGAIRDNGIVTVNLRKTTLELKDPEFCLVYSSNQYDPNYMICAGSETSSPCNYDEGSPLVQSGTIIGIMSHNRGCAPPYVPTLYTRLSAHYDWFLRVAGLQPSKPATTVTSISTPVTTLDPEETSPSTASSATTTTITTTTQATTTVFTIPTAPCNNCVPDLIVAH